MQLSRECAINEKVARACGINGTINKTSDGMLFVVEPLQILPDYVNSISAAFFAMESVFNIFRIEKDSNRIWTCTAWINRGKSVVRGRIPEVVMCKTIIEAHAKRNKI